MRRQSAIIHDSNETAVSRLSRARVLLAFVALFLLGFSVGLNADEKRKTIIFILSGDAPVYTEVATATEEFVSAGCNRKSIDCDNLVFKQITANEAPPETIQHSFLTISLGTRAAEWLDSQSYDGNQINAMLPFPGKNKTEPPQHSAHARIFIDQPYKRYFNLIRATIPRAARVGLLIHESDADKISIIVDNAKEHGLTIRTGIVRYERDVGEALSHILNDIDVLLALPDSRIHNSHTISHILTTAYRNNIPLVGFSSAYVKAGAASAVYTSPEDIARQVADTVLEFLQTGRIKRSVQQATYFSISINFEVARSLGLPPSSPSDVKQEVSTGIFE
ncbi:MAG: ABC transporter substrate binding protein [Candidatus Thiodiazotropha sp.]